MFMKRIKEQKHNLDCQYQSMTEFYSISYILDRSTIISFGTRAFVYFLCMKMITINQSLVLVH